MAEGFDWSRQVTDGQVADGRIFRDVFAASTDRLLGRDGVLLMPTMPDLAPLRSADDATLGDYRERALKLLCVAGLARTPQLSLPLLRLGGAPMGLSLLGPRGSDRSLVQLAQRLAASGLGA